MITTEPVEYPIDSANFVPSITYKDGLEITDAETNIEIIGGSSWGDGIDECVVVTSIAQAIEKSTDISQDDRDLLLEVYEAIAKGEMELPLESDYVIHDLVDISFEYEDCRCIEDHGHKDECLAEDGVTLTLTFDMGVSANANVIVMAYVNGEWTTIKSVENNGDGTVTCIFEDICPVAFVVNESTNGTGPYTGDVIGQNVWMWAAVAAVCLVGITALLVIKNLLSDIGEDPFAVNTLNNSCAFPGVHGQELQFFRSRTGNPSKAFTAKEMSILPLSLRSKSGNYRFSMR